MYCLQLQSLSSITDIQRESSYAWTTTRQVSCASVGIKQGKEAPSDKQAGKPKVTSIMLMLLPSSQIPFLLECLPRKAPRWVVV